MPQHMEQAFPVQFLDQRDNKLPVLPEHGLLPFDGGARPGSFWSQLQLNLDREPGGQP
jgi:hypothetical protein